MSTSDRPRIVRNRSSSALFPTIRVLGQQWAPHQDAYHFVLTRTWGEFFAMVAGAFVVVNTVFALLYMAQPGSIANAHDGSFEDMFYFSVQTLATIGYGAMAPATRYGHMVVVIEALTGMIGVALITGLTFAKFARPTARVLFSKNIVLCQRDGVPHLMFRLANFRHNQIVEAQLRVMVVVMERTREGDTMRRQIELPLVRANSPLFMLTWIAMHRIDEASPFQGEGALERLRARDAEIYLSVTGLDETIAQTIHARCRYALDDIVPNARFCDVLTTLEDGTRLIDYRRFDEVEPLEPLATEAPKAA
jgi:inward rectifier potassium channel